MRPFQKNPLRRMSPLAEEGQDFEEVVEQNAGPA